MGPSRSLPSGFLPPRDDGWRLRLKPVVFIVLQSDRFMDNGASLQAERFTFNQVSDYPLSISAGKGTCLRPNCHAGLFRDDQGMYA